MDLKPAQTDAIKPQETTAGGSPTAWGSPEEQMEKRTVRRDDGRTLIYYSFQSSEQEK